MNFPASLLVITAIILGGSCGIKKASDHQQRTLEAACRCTCARVGVGTDEYHETPAEADALLREWAAKYGSGELTMAWGGGMWRCNAKGDTP